jgi:mono/diheme cytochrome c family protein
MMIRHAPVVLGLVIALSATLSSRQAPFRPDIPKVWDEEALGDMEIPLPPPAPKPVHVSETYYYSIPETTIYKTYPLVSPDKAPAYVEWLKAREPEIAFDPARLKTEQDWIEAGALVFRWSLVPIPYTPGAGGAYFIRTKGVVEQVFGTCATCHSQRLADGTVANGAPSRSTNNFAFIPRVARKVPVTERPLRLHSTPWLDPDPNMDPALASADFVALRTKSGGISDRIGSGLAYPIQIPSLIGLKDLKYFDHSGRHRHRSIGDLMRYAALADVAFGMERLQRYGDFIPGAGDFKTLPDPKTMVRFSDAQLYALALYLYSLPSPPNPNKPDPLSAAGELVFRREGCASCHTPPLYTSNRLIPADGFAVPAEHRQKYDILDRPIGLDSYSTLKTRRGTGYHKVPSLRNVWLRPVLEHNGSIASLEEWFDPRRLEDGFVPGGYRGPRPTRAVKGHPFGLTLGPEDKKALIAFLRTL